MMGKAPNTNPESFRGKLQRSSKFQAPSKETLPGELFLVVLWIGGKAAGQAKSGNLSPAFHSGD
jgi:hypothetical protein